MKITKIKDKVQNSKIRNSLSFKLSMVFIGIAGILIITSMIFVFIIIRKERKEYAEREAENVLVSLSTSIKSDIDNYRNISRLMIAETRVKEYLKTPLHDLTEKISKNASLGMLDYLNVSEGIDSAFIFRNDFWYTTTLYNRLDYRFDEEVMQSKEWVEPLDELQGRASLSLNGNGAIFKSDGKTVITINRAIFDNVSQKQLGYLFLNISTSFIDDEISQINNENICVVTTDGTYLAGNSDLISYCDHLHVPEEITHREVSDSKNRMMLSAIKLKRLPIVVMYAIREERKLLPQELLYIIILLPLIYFICVFVAGLFIRRNITSPVFALTSEISKNSTADSLEKLTLDLPKNELGMIKDTYNDMVDHTSELWEKLIENEQVIQRAEMRVLQEQIKPHFLYNSIETIGYLAVDAGAEKVHSALETLGSFYRNFLSKGDREIPLKREITIIKDYLSLQKLRYGDIISDEYDIAPDTEECIIPKLILQPLVENSIYHGIRQKGEKGTIRISSHMEDGELHLIVRDTGVGMSDEQIEKVLSTDSTDNDDSTATQPGLGSNFGLWGTIERIRCYCNKDDVVKIKSEPGEYTEIEIIINTEMKNWRTVNVQSNAD
ncbi:MAG: histidine kinase [Lachnospiraceae bacterium]|nr:histidine kinase [Lachnospiraceae bacterium]